MLTLHLVMILYVLGHWVGPFTAVGVVAMLSGMQVVDRQAKVEAFSQLALLCLAYVFSLKICPLFLGLWLSVLVFLALLTLLVWKRHVILAHVSLDPTWRMPSVTRPIIITFKREDLGDMLDVRRRLFDLPEWRERMLYVSIGSYWVETISSALLASSLYNSRRWRFASYIFFAYVLPIIFALQVMGIVVPWLWRQHLVFMALVRADVLVVVLRSIFGTLAFLRVPEVLVQIYDALVQPFQAVSRVFATISSWLVPFDEAYIYVRAKLQPFSVIFTPVEVLFEWLVTGATRVVGVLSTPVTWSVQFVSTWAARLSRADRVAHMMRENPNVRKITHGLNQTLRLGDDDRGSTDGEGPSGPEDRSPSPSQDPFESNGSPTGPAAAAAAAAAGEVVLATPDAPPSQPIPPQTSSSTSQIEE